MTAIRLGILLLLLLGKENQASAGSCSTPSILCCQGANNSCSRNCFCDQACLIVGDCCSDYISTCVQLTSVATHTDSVTSDQGNTQTESTTLGPEETTSVHRTETTPEIIFSTLPPTTLMDVTDKSVVTTDLLQTISSSTEATETTKTGSNLDPPTTMQSSQPLTTVLPPSTSSENTDQTSHQTPTSDIKTAQQRETFSSSTEATYTTRTGPTSNLPTTTQNSQALDTTTVLGPFTSPENTDQTSHQTSTSDIETTQQRETISSSTAATAASKTGSDSDLPTTTQSSLSPEIITSPLVTTAASKSQFTANNLEAASSSTEARTTRSDINTTKQKGTSKVIFDLTVCTQSRTNGEVTLETLQNIARQVEGLLRRERCKDCTLKIVRIQQKPAHP
ncbi:uncharacterized protein [Salminus brasiliensis]|uniref:uncharacterized protein isoform X3 n=1 Tax=Salminus brasiliensis TaxID=930266 RepID=UPI003B8351FA